MKYAFLTAASVAILLVLDAGPTSAQVVLSDTTIQWHTYEHVVNDDHTLASYSLDPDDIVARSFEGLVMENEYLRVTLLPEYGGRILSMVYKPTGHEQLYQNPVGAPYGWWWTGTFYYDWLMVYGGIFPTLTEPEHGKAWQLPWDYEVVQETADTVSVKMSWQDEVGFLDYARYGATDIRCDFTVTLVRGNSAVETEIVLTNPEETSQPYEYWTNLALAPGSSAEPYEARATAGAEILIRAEKLKIPSWAGIRNSEEPVPGERDTYYFDNLKRYENWPTGGSAFTRPALTTNYWGVINHDNGEGLIRISDNVETPYTKIWTFGYPRPSTIDPFEPPPASDAPGDWYFERPFIELWAGVSPEFNEPATFPPASEKRWTETYVPTVGLSDITHASGEAIADLHVLADRDHGAVLDVSAARPAEALRAVVALRGAASATLLDSTFTADPQAGNRLAFALPDRAWSAGDSLTFQLWGDDERMLLAGGRSLAALDTGTEVSEPVGRSLPLALQPAYPNPFTSTTRIAFTLSHAGHVTLDVFDTLGRRVAVLADAYRGAGPHEVTFDAGHLPSGMYLYRLRAGAQTRTRTVLLMR